ncbi:MAG: cobyric acid synthase [Caldilinea sp.]|nr:cobyric acid synthase [Caldilinea sp.]MDW8441577.1 cobyric acid synthase [Caldilineaceae bacterium]
MADSFVPPIYTRLRPEALATSPTAHGSIDFAEMEQLGLDPGAVLDFSQNSNPFGPSTEVRQALQIANMSRYPDRECNALRRVLATQLQTAPESILVGNGASEILWLTAFVFLRRGDSVLILGPTYGEYARVAALMGATVHEWRGEERSGFTVDPEAIEHLLRLHPMAAVFLCNPNNPTGRSLPVEVIHTWARRWPHTLFVVDESYLAFLVSPTSAYAPDLANLLIVRSLTKEYALAGLRLGYALAAPTVIEAMRRVQPPWSVNTPAQVAGMAALADRTHLHRTLTALHQAKEELVAGLQRIRLQPLPSETHFMVVRVGDGAAMRRRLLAHGLLVRDCTSFGLPAYIRIAARKPEDNLRLLNALQQFCSETDRMETLSALDRSAPLSAPTFALYEDKLYGDRRSRSLRARALMVLGTHSSAGKSFLTTALCRILARRGVKVAPFKAQNMSNNAGVTPEGGEMSRAQIVQAEAAGIAPHTDMNPVLLKPEADHRSQIVLNGKVAGRIQAGNWFALKQQLWTEVCAAYDRLAGRFDVIVLEGAGSPAEINLKAGDIVNMRMAHHADATCLLVGDIDRGGVFAALAGTLWLLEPEDRSRIRGLVINKFRGDPTLLGDVNALLREKTFGAPVLGVLPYLPDLLIPDEDAVSLQPDGLRAAPQAEDVAPQVDIAIIRLPHIANFDEFDLLSVEPGVRVRYVSTVEELGMPHAIILPGAKSTLADLAWLRSRGLDRAIIEAARHITVVGICGGYQMLGERVDDPHGVEGPAGASMAGLGLLPVITEFARNKHTYRSQMRLPDGSLVEGYEIHMGETFRLGETPPFGVIVQRNGQALHLPDGAVSGDGRVWGVYLHDIFTNDAFRHNWLRSLGWQAETTAAATHQRLLVSSLQRRAREYDRLADVVEAAIGWPTIERLIWGR